MTRKIASYSSAADLAAYYDRQMATIGAQTFFWAGRNVPEKLPFPAAQVGVSEDHYLLLTSGGELRRFEADPSSFDVIEVGVSHFWSGNSGVFFQDKEGKFWYLAENAKSAVHVANFVPDAAIGDSADYYIDANHKLFVRGLAHRGQYGTGVLDASEQFVFSADNVANISAHTGHAVLLTRDGKVMGTGGNRYGPLGHHGFGDKATEWGTLLTDACAISTGAFHSLAITKDGELVIWGKEFGLDPQSVMTGIVSAAAGSEITIALHEDGTLWQFNLGQPPERMIFPSDT